MSVKHKGSDAILYKPEKGALITSGSLDKDSWYKIAKRAKVASGLPELKIGCVFNSPQSDIDTITLSLGDEVYPLTLTEICKTDIDFSGEMGTIDATDSCDAPYTVNLPDGFVNLSGSINTMLRFDEETDEIVPVTEEFLNKFLDVVYDDGTGTYEFKPMNDEDLLLMILLNKNAQGREGKVQNWLITPIVLTSLSSNIAMKDMLKGDYSWSKGQGPATFYKKKIAA